MLIIDPSNKSPHQLFGFRLQFEKSVIFCIVIHTCHVIQLLYTCLNSKVQCDEGKGYVRTGWRVERRKVVLDGIYFHDLKLK